MKKINIVISLLLLGFLFSATTGSQAFYSPPTAPAAALGDSFSYQGYLTYNGQPANGAYDFKFSLWADSSGVSQVGSDFTADDQKVLNGYFTVMLDFGAGSFQGDSRWLKIEMRPGAETGAYSAITTLQELTAAPYALYAKAAPWSGLIDVPAGFADNTDNDTIYTNGSGLNLVGNVFSVDTSVIQQRVNGDCSDFDSSIASINANGTVNCHSHYYQASQGVTLVGRNFLIDSTYTQRRVSSSCPAGYSIRVIAEDGSVSCESDSNTTYTYGNGLLLTGVSFSIDSAYTQRRVSSSCPAGQAISAIAENGTVTCQTVALANSSFASSQVQQPVNLSSAGYAWNHPLLALRVGSVNQVTIGADGLPLILLSDASDSSYKIVHCNDLACTTATTTRIASFSAGSDFASMALDPDGRLQISYYDALSKDLYFGRCADIACTSVITRPLVALPNDVGTFNDIIIAQDGFALVVYADATEGKLDIAHCTDRDCSNPATISTVDPGPLLSKPDPSMIQGADGMGLIAYQFSTAADLKAAHCTDPACTTSVKTQLTTAQTDGYQPSITVGADALGLIAYWDKTYQRLAVVHCADALCASMAAPQYIHNLAAGNLNPQPMITISAAGLGVITFSDKIAAKATQVVAHCNNLLCSSVTEQTWITGSFPSAITIGPAGNPLLISPGAGGTLQVILCNEPFCGQYFRRR